jgi:hypothetical protein
LVRATPQPYVPVLARRAADLGVRLPVVVVG